jgi:bacteriocin-like protein
MKKLSLNELESIEGGGNNAIELVCAGAGAAGVVLLIARVALGPVGIGIGAFCATYGLGRALDWW